ncbi:MMPL family transporter [Planomonospora venezuelensis]|uniref:RND superfamily putative drug exporter n=1 Tax=Planomonospora venezuelensis TaxID=1999 RepID=A0A841D630_PLAVE|nr:MMPL family transporter [Planomonospora venezuelensis]MBB5965340.1 RND superfamily putative drug exporter [Planomonospora venezuelensis]
MFESLGRAVYRGRWSLLVLGTVFAVLAGYFGLGLFGRMSDGGFEDPGAESTSAAEWGREWFGGSSPDVVVLYSNPAIDADDDRFRDTVHAALKALPSEHVGKLSTYWTTNASELVSTDRHSTYALVSLRGGEITKRHGYEAIEDRLRQAPAGYTVQVGGRIPLLQDLNTQTGLDLQQAEAISMPVLLVLLVLVFGSLVAAGLPLVVGLLAVIGALALLRLLTEVTDVSVFSLNVVTMLGLGLAIDYSLFVLNAFREEMRRGSPVETAVVRTMATAGRTVAFSGLTVATSLCGLLLFPQMFLRSIGLGAAAVVLVAMAAALVVLPALLAVLGPKVDAIRIAPDFGAHRGGGTWHAIASSVMRRPVLYLVGVSVLLLALAAPFTGVRFGSVDHRVLPEGFESRQVAERIDRDFARNAMAPIDVIVLVERDLVGPMTSAAPGALTSEVGGRIGPIGAGNSGITPVTEVGPLDVKPFADRLERLDHVTGVDVTGVSQNNGAVRLAVRYDKDPMSDEARALVQEIRDLTREPNFRDVVVGGPTAAQLDLEASLTATLPWTALVVCLVIGLLLFAAFGSILLPVKAILMNVLSLGASFGVIVWAFQDGHLADFLGFTPTGSIEATVTVLILAVVFGLSMDYELFLLSRVRAEWLRSGDNTVAVAVGLEKTGGVITSAALLLLVVIGAFSTAGITVVKMLGVGMFVAIVVDATLVRALLVPATMRLMGNANWWLPDALKGFHRRIEIRERELIPIGELPAGGTHVTVERESAPAPGAHRASRRLGRSAPTPQLPAGTPQLSPAPARPIPPAPQVPAPARSAPPAPAGHPEIPDRPRHPETPQAPAAEPPRPATGAPVRVIRTTPDGTGRQWIEGPWTEGPAPAGGAPAVPPPAGPPAVNGAPFPPAAANGTAAPPVTGAPAADGTAAGPAANGTGVPPAAGPSPANGVGAPAAGPSPANGVGAPAAGPFAAGGVPAPSALRPFTPDGVSAPPAAGPSPANGAAAPPAAGGGLTPPPGDGDPSPAQSSRQHRSNPYPRPPLDFSHPAPPASGPPPSPEPAPGPRQEPAAPADRQGPPRKRKKVIKPNLNGPGWHWAEEDEDPLPPPPLPAGQNPVRPAPQAPRTPAPGPLPPPLPPSPQPPPAPAHLAEPVPQSPSTPPARPVPPAGPDPMPAAPPVPPAQTVHPDPVSAPSLQDPAPSARPDAGRPALPPLQPAAGRPVPPSPVPPSPVPPSPVPLPPVPPAPQPSRRPAPSQTSPRDPGPDTEETRHARRAPVVSSHLIDQLEPPVRRQDSRPIVPIGEHPDPATEPIEAVADAPQVIAPQVIAPQVIAPQVIAPQVIAPQVIVPPIAMPPIVASPPVPPPPVPPPAGSAPHREPVQAVPAPVTQAQAVPRPEPVRPPEPEPVPAPAAPRPEPERAGGWVAVERRTTRVVRPRPDGAGWMWVEVEE